MSANQAVDDSVNATAMRDNATKMQQRRFNIAPDDGQGRLSGNL
jgi:hypothetical protein